MCEILVVNDEAYDAVWAFAWTLPDEERSTLSECLSWIRNAGGWRDCVAKVYSGLDLPEHSLNVAICRGNQIVYELGIVYWPGRGWQMHS